MKINWKAIGITFFIFFVIETLVFISLVFIGSNMIEMENECMWNVCKDEMFTSYAIDETNKMCYCYVDGEVYKSEFIG